MNVFFSTQSNSLDLLYELLQLIRGPLQIERAGFHVANAVHYHEFLRRHPDFEREHDVIREWDVYREARTAPFDAGALAAFEERLGEPTLWTPLIVDRRIYMGKRSTYRQDNTPRLAHEDMQRVLLAGCRAFERVYGALKPAVTFTVYTATLGDSLAHAFARAGGGFALDLRAARVKNYNMWARGLAKPPPHIARLIARFDREGIPAPVRREAEGFIEGCRNRQLTYEGSTLTGGGKMRLRPPGLGPALRTLGETLRIRAAVGRDDPYLTGAFAASLYRRVINPLRTKFIGAVAGRRLVRSADEVRDPFVFYPLHVEPELVLAQWARPWLNQIEAVRNIAQSVPVGWKVVVKEHPQMAGRRLLGYYRELLRTPNVLLYDPWQSTAPLIRKCEAVFVIRGALALDAALAGKPVVCLGHSLWDVLPPHVLRMVENPYALAREFGELRRVYRYDAEALVRFVALMIAGSCPVDLITGLLRKSGRQGAGADVADVASHPHLRVLADYTVARIRDEMEAGPA